MYKEIKIDGPAVSVLANGATAIRYNQVFKRDLFVEITRTTKDETSEGGDLIELATRLASIMHKQAEAFKKQEPVLISQDDFLPWLETFESGMGFANAASKIIEVYLANGQKKSTPKKAPGRPNAK